MAKELRRKVKVEIETDDGQKLIVKKTRAEPIAEALVDNACSMKPHSVAAFRAIRELVEPTEGGMDAEQASLTASALHMQLLNGFLRVARQKPTDELEL